MTIDNEMFAPGSLQYFDSGRLREGRLLADAEIGGLPCKGGADVVFHENGAPKLVRLSAPSTIHGIECAAGPLYLHKNGRAWNCTLSADRQARALSLPSGARVTFDEVGEVIEFGVTLSEDEEVNGIPCSARFPVWRYGTGKLSCCVLSRDHKIRGKAHREATELCFAPDGSVRNAVKRRPEPGAGSRERTYGAMEVSRS